MRLPRRDLAGHLAAAMLGVVVLCMVLSVASFYAVYGVLHLLKADAARAIELEFDRLDYLIIAGSGAVGLTIASCVAIRLARIIAKPLRSVAEAARRIAGGDLEARAAYGPDAPTEVVALLEDFNEMADRLQRTAGAIVSWNAQIAHELRTPLTILNGRLQGMVDGVFVSDEASLRGLLAQVDGLRRLVEDLRIVSLSDSGRLDLQVETIDLAEEISTLASLVEPELSKAGFGLQLDLEAGPAKLDIARLRQALLALIDNARRHADPCSLVLRMRLQSDRVCIQVVDQGPGLPPDFIARAFGQFERADPRGGRARGGSGLGLSVVQAIARVHGGEATYRRDQTGSAFTLDMPRWVA